MERKKYHTYIIPGNMVDGGRFMGFKTRNVIEGVVCGLIGVGVSLTIPVHDFTAKFTLAFSFGFPLLLLGAVGISGDPLTIFLKNVVTWFKRKSVILYNGSTRFYEESPLDAKMKKPVIQDVRYAIFFSREATAGRRPVYPPSTWPTSILSIPNHGPYTLAPGMNMGM